MTKQLNDSALDQLFRTARTRNGWQDKPVSDETIQAIYDLTKWGPTSANCCPARFVFVRSPEAKERLKPHLASGNVEKTMASPCCVIIAGDTKFTELLPELFPARDMRPLFESSPAMFESSLKRNSVLQGAYFIIAARALGLDCGPMSGFNQSTLDTEFFPDGRWKSDFLCNIGYGNDENLYPRSPRLAFEQACRLL